MSAYAGCIVGVGFFVMGAIALASPSFILGLFGVPSTPSSAANEVRAVYGGFGIMMALILFLYNNSPLYPGIIFTITIALSGMALGRIISVVLDRKLAFIPAVCFIVEALAAAFLFYSY